MSRAQSLAWQEQTGAFIAQAMQDVLDAMADAHPYRVRIENCMLALLASIDDNDIANVKGTWAMLVPTLLSCVTFGIGFDSSIEHEVKVVTEALKAAPMMLPSEPSLKLICAWCTKVMRDGVEPTSHGICVSCSDRMMPPN